MRNKKAFINMILLSTICLISCDNNSITNSSYNDISSPNLSEKVEIEKHTIAFFSNNQLIYSEVKEVGGFVNIPDSSLLSSDSRYKFVGWEGIDEEDLSNGKVEVFQQDAFYHAIWVEQFGTENKYSITKVSSGDSIITDGILDDAYLSTEAIVANTVTSGETNTTATLYFMFDDNYFYFFADVKDSSVFPRDYNYSGEQWIEHNDSIEFWIDLLHNESLKTPSWTGGWGGSYRGEPGPMCEGHFKINAGYNAKEQGRFSAGSEAIWDGWWSNACNEDDLSFGTSIITSTGYSVEYRISLMDEHIPSNLKMNINQEIGIGVKIYDKKEESENKNNASNNVITLEAINHDMSGPKKLSNFIVKDSNK